MLTVNRQVANEILFEDIVAMMSKIMAMCWGSMVWISNVTCFPKIAALKDEAGNNIFLANASGGVKDAPQYQLLGRPLLFSEKAPVLGSAGDLTLVDRSYYLEGLRQGVEIGLSDQRYFETDEIAIRVKLRNDGQPWLKGPIKQADGSNTEVSFCAKLGDVA